MHIKLNDDNDTLTYPATLSNGNVLPSWLTFDSLTHSFYGTPTKAIVLPLDIKVTATDSVQASALCVYSIFITNTPADVEEDKSQLPENT